jgi:hypothetical protein
MYIENFRQKQEPRERPHSEPEFEPEQTQSQEKISHKITGDIFCHWQAPEYESYNRDKKWYVVMTLGLLAVIIYAFFTNSPIMAITFILIGIIEYIYISREPQMLDFLITEKGIVIGKEIYEFEQMNSFWIFYDPESIKSVSIQIKSNVMPYLQIPLHNEDPDEIHRILSQYIPEIKQNYRLRDSLSRMLRL